MAERKVKAWITVNGVHVPIYEGESKEDAVKRSISKAKENVKANEDQKEKDIARNKAEKDKLNEKSDTGKYIASVGNSKIYKDGDNYISDINGKKVSSDNLDRLVYTLKQNNTESISNKDQLNGNRKQETGYFSLNDYKEAYMKSHPGATSRDAFEAFKRDEPINNKKDKLNNDDRSKGSLSDASSGKASDEARVKKETASDYDKEFGTVGKVDINNAPSAQLMRRLNDLSLGDEPVGKFWDGSAELNDIYKQLYSVSRQENSGFKFNKQNEHAMYQYRRYYNDGDVPGWARGQFNEYSKSTYSRSWGYHTTLSGQGEMELERRANKAVVSEYKRYQKFINTVPKSFAANYPNLSNTELKKKYQEYLKKNRK